MAVDVATLRTQLVLDQKRFSSGLVAAGKQTRTFEGTTTRSFSKVKAAMTGLSLVAGVALVKGLKAANAEFREAQKVGRQTDAVLRSTKQAAGLTKREIERLAESLSRKTAIDDEAIQSTENLLLTFTKIKQSGGVFRQATALALDMSTALGQDFKSSAVQLGKALNDPVKGVTALQRVGVSFTSSQRDQIEALVASGKTMEAQKLILRELKMEFGGSAAAAATPMDRLKTTLNNVAESAGGFFVPALDKGANALNRFIVQMQDGTGAGGRFRDIVEDVFAKLKSAAEASVAGVKTAIEAVKVAFDSAREFAPRALDAIKTAFNDAVAYLRDRLGVSGRDLGNWVQSVRNVATVIGGVLFGIGKVFVEVFEHWILPVIKRTWPAIRQIIEGALNVIGGIFKFWSAVFSGDWGRAWDAIKQIFKGALNSVVGIVRAATAPIREAAARIGGAVLDALGAAWGAIKGVASSAFRAAVGVVRGYVGAYRGAATSVARAVVDAFNFLRSLPGKLGGFLRDGAARIGQWVRNFFNRGAGIAKGIIDGLTSGLRAAPGALVEAAKDLGRKVIDAVKDFLGINSPSTEFMEVGRNIVAGLAKGIEVSDVPGMIKRHFGGMASLAGKLFEAGVVNFGPLGEGGFSQKAGELLRRQGTRTIAETLAQRFGLTVGSGYRTPEHNAAVGGVPNSKHTHGSPSNPGAWDLTGPVAALNAAAAAARQLGIPEVLVHDAGSGLHLHLGFFKKGGRVSGTGSGDKIPAMLEPGEYVMNRRAVRGFGPGFFEALNNGIARFQSGGLVGIGGLVDLAQRAGFRGEGAARMAAEAMAESGGNPRAVGDGGDSIGLWQINTPSWPDLARRFNLKSAWGNAQAARQVFLRSGRSFGPWHANHVPFMARALAALRGGRGGSGGGGGAGGGARGGIIPDGSVSVPGSPRELGIPPNALAPTSFEGKTGVRIPGLGMGTQAEPAPETAPVEAPALPGGVFAGGLWSNWLDLELALAQLTAGTEDDLAALNRQKAFWEARLVDAQTLTPDDPSDDIEAARGLRGVVDAIDSLTQASQDNTAQLEETNRLQKEQLDIANRALRVSQTELGTLKGVIADIVSGQLGGRIGLGFASPSFAGTSGLARY